MSRQEFLQASVVEAGRQVLARLLLEEHRRPAALRRLSPETHEALQTLRDAAAVERRARSGR